MARKRKKVDVVERPIIRGPFRLRVELKGTDPTVWRTVMVRPSTPLNELHAIIQITMGWQDQHLHMFIGKGGRYVDPRFEEEYSGHMKDERVRTVEDELIKPRDTLTYEYDFGDSWTHTITLEEALPMSDWTGKPLCLDGALSCPPEDCGGFIGFDTLKRALKKTPSKRTSEEKEFIRWAGDYDPDHFDIKIVNKALNKKFREYWP
jgi:hypothetical protein